MLKLFGFLSSVCDDMIHNAQSQLESMAAVMLSILKGIVHSGSKYVYVLTVHKTTVYLNTKWFFTKTNAVCFWIVKRIYKKVHSGSEQLITFSNAKRH